MTWGLVLNHRRSVIIRLAASDQRPVSQDQPGQLPLLRAGSASRLRRLILLYSVSRRILGPPPLTLPRRIPVSPAASTGMSDGKSDSTLPLRVVASIWNEAFSGRKSSMSPFRSFTVMSPLSGPRAEIFTSAYSFVTLQGPLRSLTMTSLRVVAISMAPATLLARTLLPSPCILSAPVTSSRVILSDLE